MVVRIEADSQPILYPSGFCLPTKSKPIEPPPPNFYPRISEKGIDFTGTIMGMFMLPPSPIGLIYLLLGLINSEETGTTEDVIDVTPETPDCDTPATEET